MGGDAGVVGAWLPQCVIAAHAVIAGESIHDGVIKGMTHVQCAGDIGWRDHDAVVLFAATARLEIAFGFPFLIPAFFYCVWLINFFHYVLILALFFEVIIVSIA